MSGLRYTTGPLGFKFEIRTLDQCTVGCEVSVPGLCLMKSWTDKGSSFPNVRGAEKRKECDIDWVYTKEWMVIRRRKAVYRYVAIVLDGWSDPI
jgi:hypothetical protein